MAKKNVTYRVFEIKNNELTKDAIELKNDLRNCLMDSKIEKRLIPVKEDDDTLKDLLGAFAPSITAEDKEYFYGVMMRLRPAKEIKALPDNFEQLTELEESTLQEIKEIAGKIVCSNLYHFLIKDKYLITDLSQIQTISSLQKYIAKLLSNDSYAFVPYLVNKDLHLKDINTVTFKDSLSDLIREDYEERAFSLKKTVTSAIKYISPTVNRLNKLMGDHIISARMTIDFERPRSMSVKDYEKKLGAILAPVEDLDSVYFTLKNGMKLLGSDLVYTHKETLDADVITPLTYIDSMLKVLKDLE